MRGAAFVGWLLERVAQTLVRQGLVCEAPEKMKMGVLDILATDRVDIPAEVVAVGRKLIDKRLELAEKSVELRPFSLIDIEGCLDVALGDNHPAMLELTILDCHEIPEVILVENIATQNVVG